MDIEIDDKEFGLFQQLIYEESGICLTPAKKELVKSRLATRLREKSFTTFKEYYKYVTDHDHTGEEMVCMLDCISTNLTRFFREDAHFDFLISTVIPRMLENKKNLRDNKIRIWSAGCSSGEEPYTISMVVSENITPLNNWNIKILATDLSTRVLKKAITGVYTKEQLKSVPPQMFSTYFKRLNGNTKNLYQIDDSLKNLIAFRRLNLTDSNFPFKGLFDFIFCRNVMIYFDKKTQNDLILKFYKHLSPDGYLFIGHSESLAGTSNKFRYVRPTIYQK
jgi:chemotaxis protein methyltransferase CheR